MGTFTLIIFLFVLILNILTQIAVWEELKRAKEKSFARASFMFLAQTIFLFFYTIMFLINFIIQ